MSFSVRIVDANHRPDLYAEIERDEELIAEAFVDEGEMRVALVGADGSPLWIAAVEEIEHALAQARQQLVMFGLLDAPPSSEGNGE
jgi:hypothetical protein